MADPRLEYSRLAARSRLSADALTRRTVATLHDDLAALLVRLVESGTEAALTADRAQALATSVRRLMARLAIQMAGHVGDGAALAYALVAQAPAGMIVPGRWATPASPAQKVCMKYGGACPSTRISRCPNGR